ncbi:MAG: hypothetical protein CYG60_20750 [Actinobacteria bacterium]|nr:MAG: hypothetical protein CYG60_20750 [Actinomycetota bacterium]
METIETPVLEDFREDLVPFERNFEFLPLFLPNREKDRRKEISYQEEIILDDGRSMEALYTATGSATLGLPGDFDQDAFVGVMSLLQGQGGPDEDGKLWYRPYRLLQEMGRKPGGRQYEDLTESMERIGATHFRSRRVFYSAKLGRRISRKGFGLWDYDLAEHEGRHGSNLESSWVRFDDVFLDNYRLGYLDRLDVAFYRSLRRPTSKRLFRLLNVMCGEGGEWNVNAFALRDLVPLVRYSEAWRIKEKLKGAHEELKEKGFLLDVSFCGRGTLTNVVYSLAPNFGRRRVVDGILANPEERFALELLASYKMSHEDAALRIKRFGPERCVFYAEEIVHQKKVRNPVAWLKSGIDNDFLKDLRVSVHKKTYARPDKDPPAGDEGSTTRPTRDGEPLTLGPDVAVDSGAASEPAQEAWLWLVSQLLSGEEAKTGGVEASWFELYQAVFIGGDVLLVRAPDTAAAREIMDRYGEEIGRMWRVWAGAEARIFVGDPEETERALEVFDRRRLREDGKRSVATRRRQEGYEWLFGEGGSS